MIYKDFGATGVKMSAIGFGTMRWLSEEVCHECIARGLELGINYIDTGSGYVDGDSEVWSGRALKGHRDKIYIGAKSKWNRALSADETRKEIDKRLEVLGVDYVDFYQIWGLGTVEVAQAVLEPGGMAEGMAKAKADGVVRYGLGFTFHGPAEAFNAAVDTGAFVTSTVSYNVLQRKDGPQIDYGAEHGLGMIVMNPHGGGMLALAGEGELDFLRGPGQGANYGALRFIVANPNVATAIIGFMDVSEVDAAAKAIEGADELGEDYRADLIAKMDAVKMLEGDFCTGCGYCKKCPNKFNVVGFMKGMRDFTIYRGEEAKLRLWLNSTFAGRDVKAQLAKCVECGECEEKCPQKLQIIAEIRRAKTAVGMD